MIWEVLERRFREIGVPLRAGDGRWFNIDVRRERSGERIELSPGDASVQVMDANPAHEQLLLLVTDVTGYGRRTTRKILCGRDERSLFAVTVPNPFGVAVNSVAAAHEALKPEGVRAAESAPVRRKGRWGRAKAETVLRQGDWFFVPYDHVPLDQPGMRKLVRLGGGNPHVVDYLMGNERRLGGSDWMGASSEPVFARGFVRIASTGRCICVSGTGCIRTPASARRGVTPIEARPRPRLEPAARASSGPVIARPRSGRSNLARFGTPRPCA